MKVHPRNEGTEQIDLVLLALMPVSIIVLCGLIAYMALDTLQLAQ